MIDAIALLGRVLGSVGLRVSRFSNSLNYQRARVLKERGVNLILDVGANDGQYSQEVRRMGYAGRVVSFEPLSAPFLKLQQYTKGVQNHECRQIALGNADGSTSIFVSDNVVSSSLLPVRRESVEACAASACVGSEEIQLRRLDSLRSEILRPDELVHLKLDTQGTESDVLLGARETLTQVVSIETEMSVVPLYENQLLLPRMFEILQELGFCCVWIERVFTDPRSGDLLQVDGLFVRR